MRPLFATLGLLGCATAVVATAAARLPAAPMTVTLSSLRATAHPVRLTATLRYEMQCGYPGPEPVKLTVPAPPGRLPRSAVLVNGKPATAVATKGRVVTIAMPKRPQILCDAIGPGALRLRVGGLRNPAAAGTYRVTAVKGAQRFGAVVHVVHG